jgi:hypothetical protein
LGVAIQEVPDTEKIKHETNKIFLGFGASVIQRYYETWKIKPRFYFAGFLRFVCDMALMWGTLYGTIYLQYAIRVRLF